MITSPHNDRIKLARALLTQSKARTREGKVALEGLRLIRDALECGYVPDYVLHAPELDLSELDAAGAPLLPTDPALLADLSDTEQTQGIVAVFPLPERALPQHPTRALILDNLRDPGNLGTVLRTAGAAGVEVVLLSPGCVDPYNPKVLRAGMGAHFRLPVVEANWTRIAVYCQQLAVYLADMQGDVTYDAADWAAPWALIIGSEAHGASPEAELLAAQRVYVPMSEQTESLNAAIAAGVLLFEAARQRRAAVSD
jgi:TrmH family RNA methyltransferase